MTSSSTRAAPQGATESHALEAGAHLHLVGLGGVGLSAAARHLRARGHEVSGTDLMPSPVLSELFAAFSEVADGAVDRALAGPLSDLAEADQQAVRRLASELGKRFANLPASGLRTLAAEGGMEPVRAFLGFRDPLAARLRAAADRPDQESP